MTGASARNASRLEALAEEQAALRRVATLVAQGAPADTLFAVVAEQVADVLRVPLVSIVRYEPDGAASERASRSPQGAMFTVGTRWSLEGTNVVAQVRDSGRPARIDDYEGLTGEIAETVRRAGIGSTVGSPIAVAGRLWGVMVVSSSGRDVLPRDTEARLAHFTELVATAIANSEAREEIRRLADEQAALRRVATLVAREASRADVFAAIAEELGRSMGVDHVRMWRFEEDDSATTVASAGVFDAAMPVGLREPLVDESLAGRVRRSGGSQRVDDYAELAGRGGEGAREIGVGCAVATPIVVEGRLWGAMVAASRQAGRLPADTETRMDQFTELMATAIANTEARAEVQRLAAEQAALRRVATLVAKDAPPEEVFAKVAEEVAHVLGDVECALVRDEGDGTASITAISDASAARLGTRLSLDEKSVTSLVLREGRPARIDDYSATAGDVAEGARGRGLRSSVGCPIVVGGRTWGVMAVATHESEPLPAEAEPRIAQFSELVATAIANSEARTEVRRLADEQAALRRVATLVASGASPTEVFDAVAAEMNGLLDADGVTVSRYEAQGEVTVVAHRGPHAAKVPPGTRVRHDGENVTTMVRRSRRPARMEQYQGTQGAIAELVEQLGVRSSVGAPIVVDGRLWGVVIANWQDDKTAAAGTEERMAQFAELLDTAIANADARDQLTASRIRLLAAGDEARRRVVRDLHDGAQQRLVHTIVTLKLARQALEKGDGEAASLVREALAHAQQGNAELRELAHGLLPTVLARGGLRAAVDTVVTRINLPVELHVTADRYPAEVEATAYFIVAEALTNVVKHARASHAQVRIATHGEVLHVEVRDDGIGGADPDGHGLVGIGDRAAALGGRLEVESPEGGGTVVTASLPVAVAPASP